MDHLRLILSLFVGHSVNNWVIILADKHDVHCNFYKVFCHWFEKSVCYYHELILSMLQLVDAIRHCIDFSTTCKTLQSLELLELEEDQRGKSSTLRC